MRTLIFGSGSIGCLLGARLQAAGASVAFHDDRATLAALRERGLTVLAADGSVLHLSAAEVDTTPGMPGPDDLVVLAVKAHQIAAALDDLEPWLRGGATLLTLQNGLPWWYFHGSSGRHAGRPLRAVDPDGAIARRIDPAQIVGCVAYPAAETLAPGRVRHVEGERFPVGEPDGSRSARVLAISEAFTRAGFKSPVLADIRSEIWLKAWGNLAFNPVSALTRMTMAKICRFEPTLALVTRMMLEAQEIAARLDVTFRVPLQRRLDGAALVGAHKTSMLQDLEAGRALEVDAILGAVIELGALTGVPTPTLEAVHALTRAIDPGATSRET
jgi:2-dehydropantoate 2-reductase